MHTYVHMWLKSIVRCILLGRKSHRSFGIHTYWGVVLVLRLRFMFFILCCPAVLKAFARHGVHDSALDRVSRRRRSIDADLDSRGLNP